MSEHETLVSLALNQEISLAERHEAFCELVLRFQDMAYGYAFALLGDAQLAQDAAQEAFISAYQYLAQLNEPGAFPGWLRRIVFTQCARQRRGKAHLQDMDMDQDLASEEPDPLSVVEHQELADRIRAAIRELPEQQRMATVLYYIDGYSQQEVAGFLETSVDAVKKQLQRARARLQERMMDMVRDDLQKQRPSNDDRLIQAVRLFTALKEAAEQGELSTIELMLVDGVDPNARNESGQTLLHWAAREGNLEAAELLLRHGARPDLEDDSGKTPLRLAQETGHKAIAELIHRHTRKA